MKHFSVLLLLGVLVGCDAGVKIDPEGYRCDVGGICPSGFACNASGTCQRSSMVDPSCANVVCTMPPATTCTSNDSSVRTFVGRCVAGACQYDPVDMACTASCAQGACVDACAGVSCVTPPGAACADASTLRTFAQTGACTNGACAYQQTDTTCPSGCMNGACQGVDLCAMGMVVCNAPPATTCVGSSRRVFNATGTCEPGTGICTYASNDMVCPNGCAQGACLTPSLMFSQTGPRLKFAVNALDVAPSSSGNSALAVGNNGKLARWDGSMWTELASGSTNKLTSVAFVSGTVAFAVGERSTALSVRPSMAAPVTPVVLTGTNSASLVAVSGRSDQEVVIAAADGQWWRARGGVWTNGSLPSSDAPYTVTGAYMDESLRERIVGRCGSPTDRCVAYRNAGGGTPNWTVQFQAGSLGYSAVGGSFDIPTSASTSTVFVGAGLDVIQHDTIGFTTNTFFSTISPSPALQGDSVVGITAQANLVGRDVYVLTSSVGTATGHLYRLARGVGVSSTDSLTTFYGEEHLSPNDANGVLVAEVRRSFNVNNIFRRGPITNEAFDVGEDFIGASADGTGALYFASAFGDVAIRRPNAATFEFRRPPEVDWTINGLDARGGTGLLLVGENGAGEGLITRLNGTTFTEVTALPNATFKGVCRVSDTEAWAVGERGTVFRVSGTTGTAVSTPTTNDLLAVDCSAGAAIACGASGTVLRLNAGNWSHVTPAFPGTGSIKSCKLTAQGAIVGGDGFLYAFANNQWTMLQGRAGLVSLVARGPGELYGAFSTGANTSELSRFDGAQWSPALVTVAGSLGTGVNVGGRVVWGGTLGAIVEGR